MKKYLLMAVVPAAVLFASAANAELVAHWTFDEGSGDVAQDSTANANNGTIYDGSWTSGILNGALQFNGSSTYAVVPHSSSLDITGSITISAWIKMVSVPTNYVGIAAKGGGDPAYNLEFNFTGATVGLVLNDDSYHSAPSNPLTTNTWYLITGTYDMSQIKLYVNGNLQGVTDYSGTYESNLEPLYIGHQQAGADRYYDGLLDDLRIYNNALTDSEIKQLYNAPEPATLLLLGLGAVIARKKARN
jgi:hypothetical protein